MATRTSAAAYASAVRDRVSELHEKAFQFQEAFISGNPNARAESARRFLVALERLQGVLSDSDAPEWLSKTIVAMNSVVQSHSSVPHVMSVFDRLPQIRSYQPAFDADASFNFDRLFVDVYHAQNVQEVLDSLLSAVRALLCDDSYDSESVRAQLRELLAILDELRGKPSVSGLVKATYAVDIALTIFNYVYPDAAELTLGASLLLKSLEFRQKLTDVNSAVRQKIVEQSPGFSKMHRDYDKFLASQRTVEQLQNDPQRLRSIVHVTTNPTDENTLSDNTN